MIQKEMLEYQDLDLELEKIKNTVGKSPDNVIRVRAGKQLAACKAKINEIMPKYKNLRAQTAAAAKSKNRKFMRKKRILLFSPFFSQKQKLRANFFVFSPALET